MADKSVGELIAAQSVTPTDLFVLEQNGTAKKLTGQVLENWLVSFADGHGGIQSIVKHSTSGLVDTYRITLADTTTFDFLVTNGRDVRSITKTGNNGLVDTYTIRYNDNTTDTLTVTNGAKGDKGDNSYVWIKYASQKPTASSHSFGDVADNWIGVYSGESATAPTDWTQYEWFQIKGEKGDTGAPAALVSSQITYQVGDSGTIIPSGSWSESIPPVSQGKYLWTREITQFNTGNPITKYSVSRFGIDGSGSVSTVADISPNADGNVPLKAEDIGAVPSTGGEMTGELKMNGQPISGLNAPTENDQAANKGYTDKEITDRVIYGKGKNLLKNTAKSQTIYGVTFTVNDDGSITANGTATNNAYLYIPLTLESGKQYILSGCPKGGGDESYNVMIQGYVNGSLTFPASDGGNGDTFTHPEGITNCDLAINIAKGVNASNLTFYPMVRLASETDDTYEPYYEGLKNLTDRGMELLWKNASPTSEFPQQSITVEKMSESEFCLLKHSRGCVLFRADNGWYSCSLQTAWNPSTNIEMFVRPFTAGSDNVISFVNCYTGVAATNTVIDNGNLIPLEIYAIKGVSA